MCVKKLVAKQVLTYDERTCGPSTTFRSNEGATFKIHGTILCGFLLVSEASLYLSHTVQMVFGNSIYTSWKLLASRSIYDPALL